MRTIIVALALGLAADPVSAGGRPPPPFPSFANRDPQVYSLGFSAAIDHAVVRAATHKSYLEHLGAEAEDQSQPVGGWPSCSLQRLEAFSSDPAKLCQPAQLVMSDEDCNAKRWCAQVKVSADLAKNPHYAQVISEAVSRPCAQFDEPNSLSPLRRRLRPKAIAFDASELWSLMRCNSRTPMTGRIVTYNDNQNTFVIQFK